MSQDLPPQSHASDLKTKTKSLLTSLSESAGAAAKLVAMQAERTKNTSVTLPAAYRALGKDCLQQKRHLDCVSELTAQLRSVLAEIKQLAETAAAQDSPQSFTDKAKAVGKQALDLARTKQLGMKRDSIIAGVGKAIYEQHSAGSGPIELVSPIQKSCARIAELDMEIGQQSQVGTGSALTPKRMLVGVGVALVLVSIYVVSPRTSGDVDWSAKRDEEKADAIAKYEPQFLQMLKEGDSAWDAGKKDDGVQHYAQLLAQFCGHGQQDRTEIANLHKPEMARAAGRAIDSLADSGNDETAKDLIRKADQSDLVIVYSSPKVNRLVKEAEADRRKEEQETDKWLETQQSQSSQHNSSGVETRSSDANPLPSGGRPYIPSHYAESPGADENVDAMRRAGTYSPQAERNIRDIYDAMERQKTQ